MEQGFFSRNDRRSIILLEEMFTDSHKYVYLIEHSETKEFLTIDLQWTKDPLEAFRFKTEMKARTFAIQIKITDWIITEHEF